MFANLGFIKLSQNCNNWLLITNLIRTSGIFFIKPSQNCNNRLLIIFFCQKFRSLETLWIREKNTKLDNIIQLIFYGPNSSSTTHINALLDDFYQRRGWFRSLRSLNHSVQPPSQSFGEDAPYFNVLYYLWSLLESGVSSFISWRRLLHLSMCHDWWRLRES